MPHSGYPLRSLLLLASLLLLTAILSPTLVAQDDCATKDPYGLACLVEFMSAPNPPQSIARFSDHLSVMVVGKGELGEPPDGDDFAGEDTAAGDPRPDEPPVEETRPEQQK